MQLYGGKSPAATAFFAVKQLNIVFGYSIIALNNKNRGEAIHVESRYAVDML